MLDDKQMLETISETADMGRESLKMVLDKTEDQNLKHALTSQMKEYDECFDNADRMLRSYGLEPKKANPMAKMSARMTSAMKTMSAENTTSKIAEMVIEGSTMGVTTMTKSLHEYSGNDKRIEKLALDHLKTEEANIDQMHAFL